MLGQPQVLHFDCLQNTHHHAHISLSVFISFWRGTATHFPQEPQFLAFPNQRKYLERWLVTAVKCLPGASETFFWFETKCYMIMSNIRTMKVAWQLSEVCSCGTPLLMKVRRLYTLNLWQDPLKARALVYQFAFNITKLRWRALQRSGLFYLASKLPPSHPFTLFFLLSSLFHFKCEVKVCVNICRANPLEEKTSRWMHVCTVRLIIPVSRLSVLLFWKKRLSRLVYTLNKPVLTKQGGEQRM